MTMSRRILGGALVAAMAIIVLAIPANAQDQSASDLMAEAVARHDREEFAEAVQLYESLVADGYHDAALYYNLGNAYLGSGDLGRAMLNYLRAEDLSPRDPDIRTNLEHVREITVDRIGFERTSLVESVSYGTRRWMTPEELGALSLPFWTLTALAISALIIWRTLPMRTVVRVAAGAGIAVTVASLVLLVSMQLADPYSDTGVVVIDTVEVLSGPGSQYPDEFIIHSGAQVRLVDSRHGWVRVSLPGGELQGWAPVYSVEAVARNGGV